MKRFLLFMMAAVAFTACDEVQIPDENLQIDPEKLVETELVLDAQGDFPTEPSASVGTLTIDKIEFEYCQAYYNDFYQSFQIDKATDGYIKNVTPLKGLKKIVMVEDFKYFNLDVFAGESADDVTEQITESVDGTEYTFVIPEGCEYIIITNPEVEHNATADKITFTYMTLDNSGNEGGNGGNGGNEGGTEGGGTETPDPDVEGDYTFDYQALGTTWLNDAEVTLAGVDWYVDGMKNSGEHGNIGFSYFNEVGGSCYNKTAFGSTVTSVVVDHLSGEVLSVYAGSTQNPTQEVTPTVEGNIYTYAIAGTAPYVRFKNNSKGYINLNSIVVNYKGTIEGGSGSGGSGGGNEGGNEGGDDVVIPEGTGNAKFAGWAELPEEVDDKGNLYYAYHTVSLNGKTARNLSVCYSDKYTCPVWVAGPMHRSYAVGSGDRRNNYRDDPDVPCYQVETLGSPYNRGHMFASSDRLGNQELNNQAFYLTNIGPQLISGFNTGGGIWNNYEDWIQADYLSRSDTLYMVNGCHWENTNKVVKGTTVPTHYYKAALRCKKANSTKWVGNCTSDELECVVFYMEHKSQHGVKPNASHLISVAELEKKTGFKFFTNVPNAPKSTFKASDWGL